MKITKLVTAEVEVDVSVSIDDICAELSASEDAERHAIRGLNSCLMFMAAIPAALIEGMPPAQRKIIRTLLVKHAEEYRVRGDDEEETE